MRLVELLRLALQNHVASCRLEEIDIYEEEGEGYFDIDFEGKQYRVEVNCFGDIE